MYFVPPTVGYNRSMEYDTSQSGMSAQHYILDEKLEKKYTTIHHRLRGNFSLFLNEETGSNGDNDVQHRGILRVGSEKLGKWPKIRFFPENETFRIGEANAHVRGVIYAKFVDDKRVVVPVNETLIPSFRAISDRRGRSTSTNTYNSNIDSLCSFLLNITRQETLDKFPERGIPPVVLNVDAECDQMNYDEGQGSLALSIYGLRVASAVARVDLHFQCNDTISGSSAIRNSRFLAERAMKMQWIFPWLSDFQPSPSWNQSWAYGGTRPSHVDICPPSNRKEHMFLPLDKFVVQIRSDVQKMAVSLMGAKIKEGRKHSLVPLDADPWFPDAKIDDVIVYLPCHDDVIRGAASVKESLSKSGLVHFTEYVPLIQKETETIGIITQARSENENGWCRNASFQLVDYFREIFRDRPVVVSLYDQDPLPLQYARMAMAKQTIGSFSIFPLLAIMGSFGEGYYLRHQDQNTAVGMASDIFEKASKYSGFGNLHPWTASKVLSEEDVSSMRWDDIATWLGNTTAS
ncbi:hypothetical protein IV203_009379 [Nitzschia inconspicua]|uniref:Uncharacterized protein n=1 Tax=Nitzschia inconspicua TaxID=303405 RepID=A0A9K3L0J0_9STRA|nr:hypothetical protein IV203_009379 [Nitzschia inconspicua]